LKYTLGLFIYNVENLAESSQNRLATNVALNIKSPGSYMLNHCLLRHFFSNECARLSGMTQIPMKKMAGKNRWLIF